MKHLVVSVALFASMVVAAGFVISAPAGAKPPAFSVAITASPPAYSGPCPVTVKYTGVITGDPGEKLSYQIARIVGGSPSLMPWTSATMTATGKLMVLDTITVTAAQAGIETETLRVLPGPSSATVKVSITCIAPPTPTPTPKPKVSLAGGVTTTITPAPSPQPSHTPFNPGVMLAPGAHLPVALPPPINLTQALTKEVCQAHGGSAGSFACYIGLPAGKVALVWDYPYPNPIDGYNVYRADTAPPGPMAVHMLYAPKPIATQANPAWKFVILDAQKAGSCFNVTAYHGSDESARSIRFCLGSAGVAKFISLNPDRAGAMVADFYIFTDKSVQDNMYANNHPFIRDLLSLAVGYTHTVDLWRDQAHTQVSGYTNSLFRGYLHFNTFALNGHQIAQAKLSLLGGSGPNGQICLAHFGPADHLWNPGDNLGAGYGYGSGPYQGPDLHLDVTPLVQGWANAPGTNLGISLDGEQHLVIYDMVILSSSCFSNFQSETLDVTYY